MVNAQDVIDVHLGLFLELLALGVEVEGLDVLGGVAEVRANGGLKHLGNHVFHRAQVGDDLGGVFHRNVDDHAHVHVNVKGVGGAQRDRLKVGIELVGAGTVVGPIEQDLGGRNDIHLEDLGIDRVLTGLERVGPNAFIAVGDDFCVHRLVGQVGAVRADVARDDAAKADVDADHRGFFDGGEPGINGVVAGAQHRDLQALLAPGGQECGRILEVVMGAERQLLGGDLRGIDNRFALQDGDDADLVRLDVRPIDHADHLEERRVDSVATGHQHLKLAALFTAIANEGLAIIEAVVAVDLECEQAAFGDTCAVRGLDQTNLTTLDLRHRTFLNAKKNRIDAIKTGG